MWGGTEVTSSGHSAGSDMSKLVESTSVSSQKTS